MQAAMMRLGTLVYLYGRGRAEVWTEDRGASYHYPIHPPVLDLCTTDLCVSMPFKCHINHANLIDFIRGPAPPGAA